MAFNFICHFTITWFGTARCFCTLPHITLVLTILSNFGSPAKHRKFVFALCLRLLRSRLNSRDSSRDLVTSCKQLLPFWQLAAHPFFSLLMWKKLIILNTFLLCHGNFVLLKACEFSPNSIEIHYICTRVSKYRIATLQLPDRLIHMLLWTSLIHFWDMTSICRSALILLQLKSLSQL